MSPDDFKRLVSAGLSTDQIAIVMEMMDRDQKAFAAAEEERKAKGRERVARWREKRNGDVTETSPKVTETLAGERARVEDKTYTQKIEPQEKKEEIGAGAPKPSPRTELEAVLDTAHAEAVIEHRQRLRKPLTAHAAKLLAVKLGRCPDPNAAADSMIEGGWLRIEAEWLERQRARGSPTQRRQHLSDYISELEAKNGFDTRSSEPTVLHLPARRVG